MVIERIPHPVFVVDRDRVVDRSLPDRVTDPVDLVLERELRRMHPDHDKPVATIVLRPGPHK